MIKIFSMRELRQALAWSAGGDTALHLHNKVGNFLKAPACFKRALRNGELIAHLFDQDAIRLKELSREFGVVKFYIHRRGQPGQHVDLCCAPLSRAIMLCEYPEDYYKMYSVV